MELYIVGNRGPRLRICIGQYSWYIYGNAVCNSAFIDPFVPRL